MAEKKEVADKQIEKQEPEKKETKEEKKPETEEKKPAKQEKPEKKESIEKQIIEQAADVKIFTIPLRKAFRKTRNKRASYSMSLVRDFLKRHLKSQNIKLGRHLNEKVWERGIEKPPRRVRVKTTRSGDEYRAELIGFKYEEFKPVKAQTDEGLAEKLKSRLGGKAIKKQEEEEMIEGKKKPKEKKLEKPGKESETETEKKQ